MGSTLGGLKIAILSVQYGGSKRRANTHFIAESFVAMGHSVTFGTVGLSTLSRLRSDYRLAFLPKSSGNPGKPFSEKLSYYMWDTLFHPVNLKLDWLNQLSAPLFAQYGRLPLDGLQPIIREADVVIIESGAGVALAERIRRVAQPGARLIYLVSDDMKVIGCHPVLSRLEVAAVEHFDSIVVVCPALRRLFTDQRHVHFIPHGLHREIFDKPSLRPYGRGRTVAVSVGTMQFDAQFFRLAKDALPHWEFHVIGDVPGSLAASNVILHGEMSFIETIPFIQHADVGIAPYRPAKGVEYVAQSSMKIQQYTYCGLPIVAPGFAVEGIAHGHGYTPGDKGSIKSALVAAKNFDRSQIPRDTVLSWRDVARRILASSQKRAADTVSAAPDTSPVAELRSWNPDRRNQDARPQRS